MSETTFKKELLSCLPFFILHLSRYFSVSACKFWLNFQFLSGMSASFTTILIEHYEKTFKNSTDPFETNKDIVEAMLGTFQVKCFIHSTFLLRKYLQDIPPILVSVMGGFLQQMYGPKRILMVSAVPSILSWFLVALGSSSISILLMSRFIQNFSSVKMSSDIHTSCQDLRGHGFWTPGWKCFPGSHSFKQQPRVTQNGRGEVENHVKRNEDIFIYLTDSYLACKQKHWMYFDVSWNDCV